MHQPSNFTASELLRTVKMTGIQTYSSPTTSLPLVLSLSIIASWQKNIMGSHSSNAFVDAPPAATHPTGAKRATWGIFHIAYEPLSWREKFSAFSFKQPLAAIFDHAPFTLRFISEVFFIAPNAFVSYILSVFWISITPALSLYFSYLIIDTVCASQCVF